MTRDQINAICALLPATTHVVQWGNSDVWKVGGKVFAVVGWSDDDGPAVSFKVSEMIYELMREADGFRPAPYLASRGMTWLQIHAPDRVAEEDLRQHIEVSHELVVAKLTKKKRAELGLGG